MIAKLAPILLLCATASAEGLEVPDEQTIAAITQDPAVVAQDDNARAVATALLTEGVHRVSVGAHDQALANFLEAYNRLPSPNILLAIAATLHAMGRTADAANTYQRYLGEPGSDRASDVKALLTELDSELALLTVHVQPHGSEVSIDGGPFVAVGRSLQLRVRPGTHTVRLRNGAATAAVDLNAFEGETRELQLAVEARTQPSEAKLPDHAQGWLVTGRAYATSDGNTRQRRVHDVATNRDLKPYVSNGELDYAPPAERSEPPEHLTSGATVLARIDGNHGKGFAAGLGIAYAPSDLFEVDVALLKSEIYGAYLGGRYIFSTRKLRPYVGFGFPLFFFTDDSDQNQVTIGGRLAAGIELRLSSHVGVSADLGIEHFFNVEGILYKAQTFDATTFAPTLGVIGRL